MEMWQSFNKYGQPIQAETLTLNGVGRCVPCGHFGGLGSVYAINGAMPKYSAINGLGSYGETVNLGHVDTGSEFVKSWALYGGIAAVGIGLLWKSKKRMSTGEHVASAAALGLALGAVPAFLIGMPMGSTMVAANPNPVQTITS